MPEPAPAPINPEPVDLQFRRAIPIDSPSVERCVACKMPIQGTYYHAAGQKVCPECAKRIEAGQQSPPAASLGKAFLYGSGAAFGGFLIYALVGIVLNMEIGLISILVGYMVGKAIRHASGGLGGRPQQILAVALTYFAITTSYIPVALYQFAQHPKSAAEAPATTGTSPNSGEDNQPVSFGGAIAGLLLLALAAPFLSLGDGASSILTILIILFGLSRAWLLTGRTEIAVMGPYETTTGSV